MIYIQFDERAFPEDLRREAEDLTRRLLTLPDDAARAKFIDQNSDFWRQKVRPVLMQMSHGKCWYSEARDIASVWHVDHFRPKGAVRNSDGTARPGYWWLAFKLSNYRLAGQVMNTVRRDEPDGPLLGKWDRFPLCEGSYVATNDKCDEDLELALILDPCRDTDWALLTFDELGRPVPTSPDGDLDHLRATVSIDLLHLDFEPLNEERRRVWDTCEDRIERVSKIMALPAAQRVFRQAELNSVVQALREMISEDAELSSVARACLAHSKFEWARRFASTNAPSQRRRYQSPSGAN